MSRQRRPRRRRWTSAVVALLCAVLAGAQSASSSALVPPPIPTGTPVPADGYAFRMAIDAGAYSIGRSTDRKAKTTITIPVTPFHAYLIFGVTSDGNWVDETADLYALSPAGAPDQYGYFAPVKVTTLAFGDLPVTATLQLSQPLLPTDYIDPLKFKVRISQDDPFTWDAHISGGLHLRLSNVTVDKVPLDVGPNCGTAQPVQLSVHGGPPDYPDVVAGGQMTGTVDIGSFANCRAHGEDLSPLFTGLLSGKGNPLLLVQGTLAEWAYPDSCPPQDPNDPGAGGCSIPELPN